MKSIIKNKGQLSFLKKSIDTLERSHKPLPNREILLLYREAMMMTRRFTWANDDGEPWQEILKRTARVEFEAMRTETDSVKVGKFLITWRDAIARIHHKLNKAQMDMMTHVDDSRTDRKTQENDYLSELKL